MAFTIYDPERIAEYIAGIRRGIIPRWEDGGPTYAQITALHEIAGRIGKEAAVTGARETFTGDDIALVRQAGKRVYHAGNIPMGDPDISEDDRAAAQSHMKLGNHLMGIAMKMESTHRLRR